MLGGELGGRESVPHLLYKQLTVELAEGSEGVSEVVGAVVAGLVEVASDGVALEGVAEALPGGGAAEFGSLGVACN